MNDEPRPDAVTVGEILADEWNQAIKRDTKDRITCIVNRLALIFPDWGVVLAQTFADNT